MKTLMSILAALRHTTILRLVRPVDDAEPVAVRPRDLRAEIARALGEPVPAPFVNSLFAPEAARSERALQASANLMDMLAASSRSEAGSKLRRAAQ